MTRMTRWQISSHLRNYFSNSFIYLFLAVLGLRCHAGFSLAAASGGYSSKSTQAPWPVDLPRAGIKPMSSALTGSLSTTEPLGRP